MSFPDRRQKADTSLGGGNRSFPDTTWGMISRLRDPDRHREGLEHLCRRYWRPVYLYARVAWAKSNEDAKDLAQAFFTWLFEDEPLRRYEPERGGFRAFLKTLLRRFVGHQETAMGRFKRGGGATIVPLDQVELPEAAATDPDAAFDRGWVRELVSQAVERVRASCDPLAFRVYESYEFGESEITYAKIDKALALEEREVKRHLFAVRELVRAEIRAELSRLTADDRDRDEEWHTLFRS